MWTIEMSYGGSEPEVVEVEGADVTEALYNAAEELGIGDNDEGFFTLKVSGASDAPSEPHAHGGPKRKKKNLYRCYGLRLRTSWRPWWYGVAPL